MSVVRCCCRALAATRQRTLCERSVKVLTSASVGLDERLAKLVHPWELLQLSGCADTQAEQTLRKFRQKYKQTHAMATGEIKAGRKRTCWSWWIWPTNYRPGASGNSLAWALTDELAKAFIMDTFLRNRWILMMSAVAKQLENDVSVQQLCGIDAPRVPATCDLFSRVAHSNDEEVQAVCKRVYKALGASGARNRTAAL